MIKLSPEYTPISHFQSDDGTKEAIVYFGEKQHQEKYIYGDFFDKIDSTNCKFIMFPIAKYTIAEIEGEAELYVLEPRKEEIN